MNKPNLYLPIIITLVLFLAGRATIAQSSVLADGDWYKISTNDQGVYKLDYDFLKNIGLDVANINPKNIQLYGNGGKVLPQSNRISRPTDLIQNAILVSGETDESFDSDDYILFYAANIDSVYFEDNSDKLIYKNHPYEESSYYFLTVGNSEGLRMTTESDQGNNFAKINSYDYYQIYDEDKSNQLTSGREWYGDRFEKNLSTTFSYSFDVPNLAPNTEIKVTSSVMAQSYATSSFDVTLNGVALGNQEIASVTTYLYGLKGREKTDRFGVNIDDVNTNETSWEVSLSYNINDSDKSLGFTNYLIFQAVRQLVYEDFPFNFRSLKSIENPFSSFEITTSSDDLQIWDVSTPHYPRNQSYSKSANTITFGTSTMEVKEFIAVNIGDALSPIAIAKIAQQNLRAVPSPDVLIITHDNFVDEAERLARFRAENDGYNVLVVTKEQVFNEFSSGSQDPTAIRDIAKYYYDKGSLKHLLLFGKCSYDFKDIKPNNKNFVTTYQSRNSLHPLRTYSSDDYFGFLENSEGDWIESTAGDHTLDIGVGRLPVTTAEQARDIVDKLISYSSDKETFGNWRNKIVFVADDGEPTSSLHHKQADQLTVFTDTTYSSFNTKKIFLDSFDQESNATGSAAPKAKDAIDAAVDKGALIVNYTGHGGTRGWAQEGILTHFMIESWSNRYKLPLFVTATCEFGRQDNPIITSGAEKTILNPTGGSIAIVTTGRPVNSGSNFFLNKAFYRSVFKKIDGRHPTLGEVMIGTKNNSLNGSSNRNFSLLGDPSMTLSYPKEEVMIDKISTSSGELDTLRALSKVKIQGHVENNPTFTGTAFVTIFDKQSDFQTLGQENPIYEYKEWENIIFQGQSSVSNGAFETEFVVPKNINYAYDHGKISVYVQNSDLQIDGNGANTNLIIGGSSNVTSSDSTPPEISIFINDTTSNERVIGSNILLMTKLADENGINISNYGIGGDLEAVLDDSITFDISEYYHASKDTYKLGWILFPIDDLATGEHTITVNASDTYSNVISSSIGFYVNASKLIIDKLYNFPNPVNTETTFGFSHNFSGDHLEINLTLYQPDGGVIFNQISDISDINESVEFGTWNILDNKGDKLEPGIYIYSIEVRSLSKGVKNSKYQKLIVTN